MGPKTTPKFVAQPQVNVIHTRASESKMSSTVPAVTILGTAEKNPDIILPTKTPEILGTAATRTQEAEMMSVEVT